MTAPGWLNDTVRNFGRLIRLDSLQLNERGTAGFRFEDGREFRLEYNRGALALFVTMELSHAADVAKSVLTAAHPSARRNARIRSGFFGQDGFAFFHARLSERDLSADMIQRVFAELWAAGEGVRRLRG